MPRPQLTRRFLTISASTALLSNAFGTATTRAATRATTNTLQIPPAPIPHGASPELTESIQRAYDSELAQFGYQLENAQALFKKYPDWVTCGIFPRELLAPMKQETGRSAPSNYVHDRFMRPQEIIAEGERYVPHYREMRAQQEAREAKAAEEKARDQARQEEWDRRTPEEEFQACIEQLEAAMEIVIKHTQQLRDEFPGFEFPQSLRSLL